MSFPVAGSPDSIVWNKLRFHAQTSTELLELIDGANVWKDRHNPVEKIIGRLINVNGYQIEQVTDKKSGEVTYTLK